MLSSLRLKATLILFLALLLSAACVRGAPARDDAVELKAQSLHYGARMVYAKGDVVLTASGARIEADELQMDQATGIVHAKGSVRFTSGGNTITAESLSYSLKSGKYTMWKASGVGKDFKMQGQALQQDIRFWAERVDGTSTRTVLKESILTTCDYTPPTYHYHIKSREVVIYPDDRLIAKNTGLYLKNHLLYNQGVMIVPLKREERRVDQSWFPKIGHNAVDGWYAKESIGYLFGKKDWGILHVDWFEKTGIGKGVEHNYNVKDILTGRFYYYRLDSRLAGASRYEFSNTSTLRLPGNLAVTYNFNENKYEYPGVYSPANRSSSFAFSKSGTKHTFSLSNSQSNSGDNVSSTYNLLYNYRLSSSLSANLSADLSRSASVFSSTERFHYLGRLVNTGKLFDSELDVERTTGAADYFVNREPELTLRSRNLKVGGLPLDVTLSSGIYYEMPSKTRLGRGDFRFIFNDTPHPLWRNCTLTAGGGLRQLTYTTRDARYAWMARGAFVQTWGSFINLRFDYNYQQPYGYSPLQLDFLNTYENLTGGLEFKGRNVWSMSFSSAYDLRTHSYQTMVSRFAVAPKKNSLVSVAATSDLNRGSWNSVDTQMRLQISPQFTINYWGYYDIPNRRWTYQDYIVTREEHDWVTSLIYRSAQKELWLNFTLKAFPSAGVSVGTNPGGVIMPQGGFGQF